MVLIKLVVCNRCSLESHGLLLLFVLSFVVVIICFWCVCVCVRARACMCDDRHRKLRRVLGRQTDHKGFFSMALVIQILIAFLASPGPEIVTATSENTDTVATTLSSVRPQRDTASNPSVTAPITPCSKVPVESINKCEDMLCRKEAGNFVINTTKCPARIAPIIDTAPATTFRGSS